MKKLLSILTSISVASVAATSVVACSVPSTKVDVNFIGKTAGNITSGDEGKTYTFNNAKYTKAELDQALNGNAAIFNSYFPVAMSFDELNSQLLSLVSFNQSLVVKTQKNQEQLRNFRNTYLGRDANEVTDKDDQYVDLPSVDGIHYVGIDNTEKYYNNFKHTKINSLVGLQDLYKAFDSEDKVPSDLKNTWTMAKNLFSSDNKAVKTLMDNFANSKKNPAFTNITYNTDLEEFKSTSQMISTFDKNHKNTLSLLDTSPKSYVDNNSLAATKDDDKKAKDDKDKKNIVEQTDVDPYGALILPTVDKVGSGIAVTTLADGAKDEKNKTYDTDKKALSEFFTTDSSNVYYSQTSKKDGDNEVYTFNQNFGEYLVKQAEPLNVTYHFETDMKHSAQSWKETQKGSEGFNISFTVNNLAEVFSPYISGVKGNTITSIKHIKDENGKPKLKIMFSNPKLTKDDFEKLGIKGLTNPEFQQDKDKNGNATDAYVLADEADPGPITYKDGDANLSYEIHKEDSEYSTNQISWIFRGYKFISDDSEKNNKETGWTDNMKVEKVVDIDSKTKAPVRSKEMTAEVTHHMRDLETTGWKIEATEAGKNPVDWK